MATLTAWKFDTPEGVRHAAVGPVRPHQRRRDGRAPGRLRRGAAELIGTNLSDAEEAKLRAAFSEDDAT